MDETNPNVPQAPMPTPPSGGSGSQNTGMAILAYLGILVVVPLVSDAKNDPFVKFHAKQGLVLLICEIAAWVVMIIPFLGLLIGWLLWIGSIVLVIMGIMNVVSGKMQELPIVGSYASKFNF